MHEVADVARRQGAVEPRGRQRQQACAVGFQILPAKRRNAEQGAELCRVFEPVGLVDPMRAAQPIQILGDRVELEGKGPQQGR